VLTYIHSHELPSPPSLCLKRKRGRETDLEIGCCFPSLPNYVGTRLDTVGGHVGAPTGHRESGVLNGGGACDLSCGRGPHISRASGGIHGGLHGVLGARVWCAITLIPPLHVVLWLGTASPIPLVGPAYDGLCNLMRGLHVD
jgi:hypothetical protein